MDKKQVISKTADYVKKELYGEGTGHDWWHSYRVWKLALQIAKKEKKADLFVVQIAALLHDIADYKLHKGDSSVGPDKARKWLKHLKVEDSIISRVCETIEKSSFKGAHVKKERISIEAMIIQDADKLDAIGAVGIARSFAFGGHNSRPIYDPNIKPQVHRTFAQYKKSTTTSTTFNHFYEKLLLLKNRMNTKTGRKLAEERHRFMEQFVRHFLKEWKEASK